MDEKKAMFVDLQNCAKNVQRVCAKGVCKECVQRVCNPPLIQVLQQRGFEITGKFVQVPGNKISKKMVTQKMVSFCVLCAALLCPLLLLFCITPDLWIHPPPHLMLNYHRCPNRLNKPHISFAHSLDNFLESFLTNEPATTTPSKLIVSFI